MTRIETAVILATELVGSTPLAHRVGSARFEDLRREHDAMLGDDIEDHGGRVIKHTGDGLLASFPSVTAALAAGVVIQQHLDRRRRAAAVATGIRVGISVGDAAVDDGDYFGIAPIEATRLCAKARSGEILVADPARAMVRAGAEHRFEALAPLELKGLPEPVTAWRVGWDPLPAADGAALPARLRGPPPTRFVGRAVEQAILRDRWDRAAAGRRQTVLISGEAGIGKTRLVAETARAALPGDALVLYGRCAEGRATPYQPWLEILRGYAEVAPRRLLRPHAAELSRLVPELGQRLGTVAAPAAGDPETERYLLFDAVGTLLAAASARAPLVAVLDDLHWADPPTLALLRHLVTASAAGRLMLVGAFRGPEAGRRDPLSPVLADLRREPEVTRIALSGLEADAVADLVEALAGGPIDDSGLSLATRLHRETAGNPFFVGEVVEDLRAAGAIAVGADGRWSFMAPGPGGLGGRGGAALVTRRVRRLGGDALDLLSAAAVIGMEFDAALLARIAGRSAGDVLDLVDAAVAAGVLVPTARAPARAYAFAQGLVRATLYADLPPARRLALHRAIGLAIEADAGGDHVERLPELAHHFLASDPGAEVDRTVDYARRAGRRAMGQLAYDQAAGLFQRALAGSAASRPRERLALLEGLGEAQLRAGDAAAARRTLLAAAQEARRQDEPEALARATLACGPWGLELGVDETLVASAREAIARLAEETSPRLLAQVKGLLAAALHFAPEAEGRHRLCADAVSLARAEHERSGACEDGAALAYVLGRSLLADWGPDSAVGDVECAELLELCRRLRHGELELLARVWRMTALLERGDLAAAGRELCRVEHMATTLGQPRATVELPLARAMTLILRGRLDEAERLGGEHGRLAAQTGIATSRWPGTAQLLAIRLLQGRMPELEDRLRALTQAHPSMAVLRAALVMSLIQAGRDAEAGAEFEAALAGGLDGIPPDSTRIAALALLADAVGRVGDRKRARWLYDGLAPYRGRWVVLPAAAVLWPVDRSLGQAAGAAGAPGAALSHLAAARTLGARADAVPTLALIALDEARLLAGRGAPGDPVGVRARSGEARALAQEVGMPHVAAEAEALDPGARHVPPPAPLA